MPAKKRNRSKCGCPRQQHQNIDMFLPIIFNWFIDFSLLKRVVTELRVWKPKKNQATLELSHSLSDISDYRDLWQIFQSTIKKNPGGFSWTAGCASSTCLYTPPYSTNQRKSTATVNLKAKIPEAVVELSAAAVNLKDYNEFPQVVEEILGKYLYVDWVGF